MNNYNLNDYQATCLIRKIKQKLIDEGFSFYDNNRLGKVPLHEVELALAIIKK